MLYVEGYIIDEFTKGNLNLLPAAKRNKIGIIFDKDIPQDVLNVHINTMNAVRTIYGLDIYGYDITEESIGIDFELNNGLSDGSVKNPNTIIDAGKRLLNKGCNAIAIVGMFNDPNNANEEYADGHGTDPVGGVEAILSHYISKELHIPCAHSPAFEDYQIYPDIVNPKSASEYITPTFLPCILIGLSKAPKIVKENGISINDVDFLVMPYNSMGSPAVLGALEHNVKVYAVKENITALNITADKLQIKNNIYEVNTYKDCLNIINKIKK